MKKVTNYLDSLLSEGDTVVIGCSGGPDSMALLHLLERVRDAIGINIVCAHVNHNKRIESEDEKVFVESYCNTYRIYIIL